MGYGASQIETDVDLLVSLVKEKGKISVDEASKILKVHLPVIQRWVDFLIEEEVLGIEYKFITPFLYFNKDLEHNPSVLKETEGEYLEDKDAFFKKAQSRNLPLSRINALWLKYLSSNLEEIRDHFFRKAQSRNMTEPQIMAAWQTYYVYLKKQE
jgi:hypothetical protein